MSFYPSYYVKENTRFNWKLKSCISFARYNIWIPKMLNLHSLSIFSIMNSSLRIDNRYQIFIKELVKYSFKKGSYTTLRFGSKTIQYQQSTFIKNFIKYFKSKINYQNWWMSILIENWKTNIVSFQKKIPV